MTEHPAAQPGGAANLPALTGIRAIAAFMVLILHANQAFPQAQAGVLPFLHFGYLGVDLFFFLSGFIISHVYARDLASPTWSGYGHYLWRRFARLWPIHVTILAALVVLVLVATAMNVTLNRPDNWRFDHLIWHVTLTHAWGFAESATWNGPAWSISSEFLAYLLFPAFLILVRPARNTWLAVGGAILLFAALAVVFMASGWRLKASWVGLPAMARVLFEFGIGCFLYQAWRYQALRNREGAAGRAVPWDAVAVIAFIGFLVTPMFWRQEFVMLAWLALFVFAVASCRGPLYRFLSSRIMVWLGETSYALYMVHFTILLVMTKAAAMVGLDKVGVAGGIVLLLALIALSIAAAGLLYHVVEQPARRKMRGWFRR